MSHRCLFDDSWLFHWYFNDVLSMIQGCFMNNLSVFHRWFIGFSSMSHLCLIDNSSCFTDDSLFFHRRFIVFYFSSCAFQRWSALGLQPELTDVLKQYSEEWLPTTQCISSVITVYYHVPFHPAFNGLFWAWKRCAIFAVVLQKLTFWSSWQKCGVPQVV